MKFSPTAYPIEIPAAMIRTCTYVGWKEWEKRVVDLAQLVDRSPLIRNYVHEKYGIEIAMFDAWEHYVYTGQSLWPPKSLELYRFYSFISMFSKLHYRLNDVGKKRLIGMARHGLKTENGLEELAFELLAVNILMSRGYSIICNDFENWQNGGTYDFLAMKDGLELEVECKYVSADIGRKIHRRRIYQLGDKLLPAMQSRLDSTAGGTLIQVTIPGRLNGSSAQLSCITEAVTRALGDETVPQPQANNQVTVKSFPYDERMFDIQKAETEITTALKKHMKSGYGIENKNMLTLFRPQQGAVVVAIESAQSDRVIDGIYRQLKDSAKNQFSGKRPASLFVYLADLTETQLTNLAKTQDDKPTGLQVMANRLIDKRPILHSVGFISRGILGTRQVVHAGQAKTALSESGGTYHFTNHNHLLAKDERLQIFEVSQ